MRTISLAAVPLFLFNTTFSQSIVQLNPVADASLGYHDNYNSANTNYNTATHFSAFCQPGTSGGVNKARGVMKFDLSGISTGTTILGAFLTLRASGPTGGTGAVTSVGHVGTNASKLKRITSSWSANTVTWNTMPTTTATNQVSLATSSSTLQDYVNVNVTALVQDMVDAPSTSHGIMIQLDTETTTRGMLFFSSEIADATEHPLLTIVYGDCPGAKKSLHFSLNESHEAVTPFIWPTLVSQGGSNTVVHSEMQQGGLLRVTNSAGAVVLTYALNGERSNIHGIGNLPAGPYWVTLETKDGSQIGTQTIIVR